MAKAKNIHVPKETRQLETGIDGTVKVTMYLPGHAAKEFTLTIPNIAGSAPVGQRSPDDMIKAIASGVSAKFGKVR